MVERCLVRIPRHLRKADPRQIARWCFEGAPLAMLPMPRFDHPTLPSYVLSRLLTPEGDLTVRSRAFVWTYSIFGRGLGNDDLMMKLLCGSILPEWIAHFHTLSSPRRVSST